MLSRGEAPCYGGLDQPRTHCELAPTSKACNVSWHIWISLVFDDYCFHSNLLCYVCKDRLCFGGYINHILGDIILCLNHWEYSKMHSSKLKFFPERQRLINLMAKRELENFVVNRNSLQP